MILWSGEYKQSGSSLTAVHQHYNLTRDHKQDQRLYDQHLPSTDTSYIPTVTSLSSILVASHTKASSPDLPIWDSCISSPPPFNLDDAFSWDEPLQLHVLSLLRIVSSQKIRLTLDGWYRLDLKLLDEFGALLQGERAKLITMGLVCELLDGTRVCSESTIRWRALHYDVWTDDVTTAKTIVGFDRSGSGGLEFKIDSVVAPLNRLYIRIVPEPHQALLALPVVIGPLSDITFDTGLFRMKDLDVVHRFPQCMPLDQETYRAFKLDIMNWYFMVQEGWHLGTPGKVWDSVLIISDMFAQDIIERPDCLEHCHLLDLSAGTGAAGLLVSSIYRRMFPDRYPNVKITLTDLPDALPLIDYNKQFNGITEDNVMVIPLGWGNEKDIQHIRHDTPPIDIIIASDLLYDPAHFSALIKTLSGLAVPGRTVIYLGYKRRGLKESDEHYFFDLCCKYFDIQTMYDGAGNDMNGGYSTKSNDDDGDDNDNTGVFMKRRLMEGGGWLGSLPSGFGNHDNDSVTRAFHQMGVKIYRLTPKQPY
ncbi:putative methyltransferase-domain-containing protein [Chlamydoabsidia padenii]|nr:putative methyltransferase-domain-containing protein [Chlamydoabsidia padenii]